MNIKGCLLLRPPMLIERKLSEKIEKLRFLELHPADCNQIWGDAREPPDGPLSQVLGPNSWQKFFLFATEKKIIGERLTPKWGVDTPRREREFIAPEEYYISCKHHCNLFKNDGDIEGQKIYLAPPSGQTERRSRVVGPKYSSRIRGL